MLAGELQVEIIVVLLTRLMLEKPAKDGGMLALRKAFTDVLPVLLKWEMVKAESVLM